MQEGHFVVTPLLIHTLIHTLIHNPKHVQIVQLGPIQSSRTKVLFGPKQNTKVTFNTSIAAITLQYKMIWVWRTLHHFSRCRVLYNPQLLTQRQPWWSWCHIKTHGLSADWYDHPTDNWYTVCKTWANYLMFKAYIILKC